MKSVAIIGGGVAGIHAAHLLQGSHEVTIFEKAPRLGGHANPYPVEGGEVDTAFMIFNEGSYPRFMAWLRELGVADRVQDAEMSFGFHETGEGLRFAVKRGLDGLFAQRKNALDPSFLRIFVDLMRFRRNAYRELRDGRLPQVPLREYLAGHGYSARFLECFIGPMSMAVWSVPLDEVYALPAETFLRFLMNHGYLKGKTAGRWKTLRGSSRAYLDAFERGFRGTIRAGVSVDRIERAADGVRIGGERFDAVFLATHADDALELLGADASGDERRLLGAWRYHATDATLHTDASLLPADRRVWSSWNMRWKTGGAGTVTYWLNRVQRLRCDADYFLTLGEAPIDAARVVKRFRFKHPIFDESSIATQAELASLQGRRRTYYCGSYFGFGFHEDAIGASRKAVERLGKILPEGTDE